MWKYPDDNTRAVITAKEHIQSGHNPQNLCLPQTAVLFYMHSGEEYLRKNYPTHLLCEKLPRFLRGCPVYRFDLDNHFCFLDGGRGAPQAVDTLETLAALGVKTIVTVGMFGAFGENVNSGDIIIPNKAFVEEGTSLHYYDSIEYSVPSPSLYQLAVKEITSAKSFPIVSTDAVYRQTFLKEQLWRAKRRCRCGYGNLSPLFSWKFSWSRCCTCPDCFGQTPTEGRRPCLGMDYDAGNPPPIF